MKKIYIICHTWRDTDMTIHHCFSNEKAVKYVTEMVSDVVGYKPDPDTDFDKYMQDYYEALNKDDEPEQADWYIAYDIVELN